MKKFSILYITFALSFCNVGQGENTISMAPGTYEINQEFYRMGILNAWAVTYIEKIEILEDYQFKIYFKWVGEISPGLISNFQKGSDEFNKNMYVTDDTSSRYDHIDRSGVGAFTLYDGDIQRGWFQFPALNQSAKSITMHDGDQDKQITFNFK